MGLLAVTEPTSLRVTDVGDFIRHRSCERWLKLTLSDEEQIHRELPFFERLSTLTMDPVLQEAGRKREAGWEETLKSRGLETMAASDPTLGFLSWAELADRLSALAPEQQAYAREVAVSGQLGEFHLDGRIDFVLVLWRDGRPRLRLVECKASRRDRTYHRIQVACYRRLVRDLLLESPLQVAGVELAPKDVEVCVVRVEEETNLSQDMLVVDALPEDTLGVLERDLERLLDSDGTFARVRDARLETLPYQLDDRCNDCFFAVYCFTESARLRRLELLGLSPAEVQALSSCGVDTIDDLVALQDEQAEAIRHLPGLALDPESLKKRAKVRLATLPSLGPDKSDRPDKAEGPRRDEVESLHGGDLSTLPEHEGDEGRLVRVYLAVDYDYSENRIGALSAHVTSSDAQLHTGMRQKGGKWVSDPDLKEKRWPKAKEGEKVRPETRALSARTSQEVVTIVDAPGWSGDLAQDSEVERRLLESFFSDLAAALTKVSMTRRAPVHFYVWDKSDVGVLIKACLRLDAGDDERPLLGTLRGLLGSRGHAEQVIYSSLSEELRRRFATAYTGHGLIVAAGLRWKGDLFHWHRKVGANEHDFAKLFAQDLFDFKARLALDGEHWAQDGKSRKDATLFEIRGRFKQNLTAPYWRAYWRTLPDPRRRKDVDLSEMTAYMRTALERYNDAALPPGYLKTFLKARVQALRWLEERMTPKNKGIKKPALDLLKLREYALDVDGLAGAALDFLALEHYVKMSDWTASHLAAPMGRVATGRSLPVKDVRVESGRLVADLDPERCGRTLSDLEGLSSFGADSFVRLTPADSDPTRGQTVRQLTYGRTCRLASVDWEEGRVVLEVVPSFKDTPYILPSFSPKEDGPLFDFATVDESPSDFVAGPVEARLRDHQEHLVCSWLDPTSPQVPEATPLSKERLDQVAKVVASPFLRAGEERFSLAADQQEAVLAGLETRIQLLQGPPGTGKTQTTAAAVLTRILARAEPGDVVCLGANTHLAVDTLLERIDALQDDFAAQAKAAGLDLPPLILGKVRPRETTPGRVQAVEPDTAKSWLRSNQDAVVLVGGTTSGLLKLAKSLDDSALYPDGFRTRTLVVDEASMLVFPHLLALATLLAEDGEVMLAGDHRQLAPIVAHDWEREDRAPVVTYTPFASAYEAVQSLADSGRLPLSAVAKSSLSYTFRLPPEVRRLLGRVYLEDGIELVGRDEERTPRDLQRGLHKLEGPEGLAAVWEEGVYLVLHSERASTQANPTEVELLEIILEAAPELAPASVGVVTPHRAQRSLLKARLAGNAAVGTVDTVERFQGGEAETIFVSACASDPAAISARAEFLLDLNRANVAFSRAKKRLFVLVSESLLDHIPSEHDLYESSLLWKSLREHCRLPVCELEVAGHKATILAVA